MQDDYETARMLRALSRVIDARSRRWGMRPRHVDVLQHLKSARQEDCTIGAVARAHGLCSGEVSWLVTEMIEAGYIRLAADGSDNDRLELTVAGRQSAALDPVIVMAEKIAELPDDRRQGFTQSLEWVFHRYLEDAGQSDGR